MTAKTITADVAKALAGLQFLEEIGGPASTADYVETLALIVAELQQRMDNARNVTGDA